MAINKNNLVPAAGILAAAGGLEVVGTFLVVLGLGLFTPEYWIPALAGLGFGLLLAGVVVGAMSIRKLIEPDYGTLEIPTLTAQRHLVVLTEYERPFWTCTTCRVVHAGSGIGSCIYCDSGAHYYLVETDADLKMVFASIS